MIPTKFVFFSMIVLVTGLLGCADDSLVKDKPDTQTEQKPLVKPDVPNTTSIQQKQNPPSGLVTEKSTTEQRTMFQIGSDTNTPTKVLGKTVESSDDRGIKKYSAPSNYDKEVVDLLRILIPQN